MDSDITPGEAQVSFKEGLRSIWRHVREYKGAITVLGVLGIISAVANGFVPYITGRFFDALIAFSQGHADQSVGLPYWMLLLIAWAVTRIVSDSVDWWIDLKRRWLDTNLQLGTQAEGFIHLLQLPLSFHTHEHIQAIFSHISSASWRITSIMRTVIEIAPQLLSIGIGITLAISINTTLAAILAAGVIAYIIALSILLRGTAMTDFVAHKAWNECWNDAAAAVEQTSAVKQATAEAYEINRIRKTMRGDVVNLWYQNELNWNRVNFWQRITVFFTQLAIFIVSAYYVGAGVITVGELVALNGYALMFFGPLVSLGYSWQVIQNGLTSVGIMDRIFDRAKEVYNPKDAITKGDHLGSVQFEDVSFRYEENQPSILSHLSFIAKQTNGYDTLVGERGIKLSVGQKQRVAIARAILRNPEFLILDEPTSALDIETEQYITASLEKLMRGRTTFIIAHRLSTVRKADRIFVIKDGAVAESGTHQELISIVDGIYRRLYDLHVGLYE